MMGEHTAMLLIDSVSLEAINGRYASLSGDSQSK